MTATSTSSEAYICAGAAGEPRRKRVPVCSASSSDDTEWFLDQNLAEMMRNKGVRVDWSAPSPSPSLRPPRCGTGATG